MVKSVAHNLNQLRTDIHLTAQACGRDPDSISILAVSKTFPPEAVEEASDAGQILFGENRVQEALSKIPAVRREGLIWHLVGHLQSNKARRAVESFDVIQTIDSAKLARRLSSCCEDLEKSVQVFIQVNIGSEPQKSGFSPSDLKTAVSLVDELPNLELIGLMTIPPLGDDAEQSRPYFRQMSSFLAQINRSRTRPLTELSMGMSGDYRVAIQEGSTLVRIGTAIFGTRGS